MLRWYMKGPGIDVICSNDAVWILAWSIAAGNS